MFQDLLLLERLSGTTCFFTYVIINLYRLGVRSVTEDAPVLLRTVTPSGFCLINVLTLPILTYLVYEKKPL